MLYLIGTGLYYLNDLPFRAVEIIKKADEVYLERYTNPNDITQLNWLEEITGKRITILGREGVENDALVAASQNKTVCLLVPGDPLAATTHMSLVTEAVVRGIDYRIIHASSIFSAIGETGFSIYKFGRTTSMPIYSENYRPESFFDAIKQNTENGMHTLVLLEARDEKNFLGVQAAVDILKGIERKRGQSVINWEKTLFASRLGGEDQVINFVEKAGNEVHNPPVCLIIPGEVSDYESGAIDTLFGKNS